MDQIQNHCNMGVAGCCASDKTAIKHTTVTPPSPSLLLSCKCQIIVIHTQLYSTLTHHTKMCMYQPLHISHARHETPHCCRCSLKTKSRAIANSVYCIRAESAPSQSMETLATNQATVHQQKYMDHISEDMDQLGLEYTLLSNMETDDQFE